MRSDIREALAEYVRACGGDPQTEATETMEQRIAKEALLDSIDSYVQEILVEEGCV